MRGKKGLKPSHSEHCLPPLAGAPFVTPFILDAGQCGEQRGQQYGGAQGRFGFTMLAPALLRLIPWQVLISFLAEQVVVGRGCWWGEVVQETSSGGENCLLTIMNIKEFLLFSQFPVRDLLKIIVLSGE